MTVHNNPGPKPKPLAERFWPKVDVRGDDECWPWLAGKTPNGYGKIKCEGHNLAAHRIAWELTNGSIPDGMLVCHRCDNKVCCNYAHLFLGTKADNAADMVQKGRAPAGESSGVSKLTTRHVQEIRRQHAEGTLQIELAVEYNISQSHVSMIVNRHRWKHI